MTTIPTTDTGPFRPNLRTARCAARHRGGAYPSQARRDERARRQQRAADRLAARSEGIAAAQPQIDALNNQILDLKEGQDAAVNDRVERERLAIEARHSGVLSDKDARIARLTKKLDEANRIAEARTPQALGKMGEVEAFNTLRTAFAGNNITRVPPGKPGADIIFDVIHDGKKKGTIIAEVKTEMNWGWSWTGKLRQDKQDRGADFAVLVTDVFPSKLPLVARIHEGVLLCPSASLVEQMEFLRAIVIKLHDAKALGRNVDVEKIVDFLAGKGADILQSLAGRGQRQKELNRGLERDVDKHIRASDKLADGQAKDLAEFNAAVDDIINGDDDDEGGS